MATHVGTAVPSEFLPGVNFQLFNALMAFPSKSEIDSTMCGFVKSPCSETNT